MERSWAKVGEVVDAVGANRKQLYLGQEYDHVFDVDIQDDAVPLKLPYNLSENPYEAAQRFLQANNMSPEYIDEVVKFIEKSTNGATLGGSSSEFVDPYTGASRYTGGGAGSTPVVPSGGYTGDPYTGVSFLRSSRRCNERVLISACRHQVEDVQVRLNRQYYLA